MKKEYTYARRWLLDQERFEDLAEFDKSDDVKKTFCDEMIKLPQIISEKIILERIKIKFPDITDINNPSMLKYHIYNMISIIEIKDKYIDSLLKIINEANSNYLL
ncbi:hypothetical protein IR083_23025 [Dysgonomonas sp. GY75]|uniref:hypothetical protein n=1 Tax=Dysgonomonas sp. GY75 TaxID=2780419 RepID=UPI0018831B4F|nr:hypothetical protein [Dysgonomonas sp. GY75]MBF0651694.1 hypothetical protein [Dysgonomonas sp. GY75]